MDGFDNNENSFKILNMVRSVGHTSMPWNDLYGTARAQVPGLMYPPLVIKPEIRGIQRLLAPCNGVERQYFAANLASVFRHIWRLNRACINKRKKLVLHVHNPSLAWIVLLVRISMPSVIVVANLHNEWSCFNSFQRLSLFVMSMISRKMICVSEAISYTIPKYIQKYLRNKNALTYIRNGIRSGVLAHKYPIEQLPLQRRADVIVIARMVPQKNIKLIIKVFSMLKNANKLVWFGDGVQKNELEKIMSCYDVKERVVLCGVQPRDIVFKALSESCAYLSCSLWEGIGVANLEAAAMGCRPFLSNIAPHNEIAERLNLDTFPLEDPVPWVEAIDSHLDNVAAVEGENSKQLASCTRERFDLDNTVRSYISIYVNLTK